MENTLVKKKIHNLSLFYADLVLFVNVYYTETVKPEAALSKRSFKMSKTTSYISQQSNAKVI